MMSLKEHNCHIPALESKIRKGKQATFILLTDNNWAENISTHSYPNQCIIGDLYANFMLYLNNYNRETNTFYSK